MRGAEEQASNRFATQGQPGRAPRRPPLVFRTCLESASQHRGGRPGIVIPLLSRDSGTSSSHSRRPKRRRARHSPKTIGQRVTLGGWPNGRSSCAEHLAATLTRK